MVTNLLFMQTVESSVITERYSQLVQTLMVQLEGRNPFNVDHCRLVSLYADLVARQMRFDTESRHRVMAAADVHTLGVLLQMEEKRNPAGVPITNLGVCTGREKSMPEREAEILERILGPIDGLRQTIPIILDRHTWFQGNEAKLSPEARVLAVVDAFVDLATPKSHRDPLTLTEVLNRVRATSGTQFDPQCVDALAAAIQGEQEQWGAGARARQFEGARYRHWLALGNFHRQCADIEWAHRCYRNALQTADTLGDPWLRIQAVFGSFMVYYAAQEYERARDLLNKQRPNLPEGRGKVRHWFMLMWGLLIWTADHDPSGEAIVEEVASGLQESGDLPGVAAAQILLGRMTMVRGSGDSLHMRWVRQLMALLTNHDLFDIVVQFRPQAIPLLLNALRHRIEPETARDILTRMGEPCQDEVLKTLGDEPSRWQATGTPEPPPEVHAAPLPASAIAQPPPMAPLKVLGLGPLLMECNGKRITEEDWPVQKAMRLFALVAFRRATFVDEELMDRFWQDRDETRARGSLRNAIHQIRTILSEAQESQGEGPRVTFDRHRRGGTSGLHGDYWLDTEGFEVALTRATRFAADGNNRQAAGELKAALALYRGDFLPSLPDEWAEGTRTHFSELHLRALHLAARCQLQLGDPESAELLARQALRKDDLREEVHVTLLETLLAQRRKAEALRHYQDAISHFRKEIGLASPSTLTAMYDKIIR